MDTADPEAPKPAGFVAHVVKDPKVNPEVLFLTGFLGASSEEGHTRLYFDVQLSAWVDIPEEAILHSQDLPPALSPLGGALLWVDSGAELLRGKVGESPTKAGFIEGHLAQACATSATQVPPCPPMSDEAGGAMKGSAMNTFSFGCTGWYTCAPPQFVSAPPNCPTVQPCHQTWNCPPTHQGCQTTQQCPPTSNANCPTLPPHCVLPTLFTCPTLGSICPPTWHCPTTSQQQCPTSPPNCQPTSPPHCQPTSPPNCQPTSPPHCQLTSPPFCPQTSPPHCQPTSPQFCPTAWVCPPTLTGHCPSVGPQFCPTMVTCTP